MKYVALKDGSIMTFYDNADYMQYDNVRENFLKEGNSIEELCDVVVLIDKKHKKPKWLIDKPEDIANFNELPTVYKNRVNKGTVIFKFGIWTDKGLIYVAKMNENGELVLI